MPKQWLPSSYVEVPQRNHQPVPSKANQETQSVCFVAFAQLVSVVGCGATAQSTAGYLGNESDYIWMPSIITIMSLALIPPLGQAADYWGRRNVILVTSFWGIIGPIIISRAHNMTTVMAGIGVLGISFGCQATLYAIPSEILHRRQRALGQATVNISAGAGAIVGVLMSGALFRYGNIGNFRIYWYVNTAIYAVGWIGIFIGYTPPLRELQTSLTTAQRLRRLDWIGFFLISAGLALFAIALQFSGNPYSWRDAHVLAIFIIGVVLLISFGAYEWLGRNDGILAHALFQDRNLPIALAGTFLEGLTFFTANTYFIFEIIALLSLDSWTACLRFVLLFVSSIVVAFAIGAYTTWTKQLRETLVFGFACLVAFNAAQSSIKHTTPTANSYGYAIIGGIGIGAILGNIVVAAQMSAPREMISVTTSLMLACRSFGAACGLAINNAIFTNTLSSKLPTKIAAAVLPLGFPAAEIGALIGALTSGSQAAVEQVPSVTPQIAEAAGGALVDSYTIAFHNLWVASCAFSALGLVCEFRPPTPL